MNCQSKFRASKNLAAAFVFLLVCCASAAAAGDVAGAKGVSERTLAVITSELTKNLRADLADDSVTVKINSIEKYSAAEKEQELGIKGNGFCVLTGKGNQLPIRFEAKINSRSQVVGAVKYNFLQFETSEFAPSSIEETLMRELMKKVSVDYKTEQIVISIDGFDVLEKGEGKEFVGIGEVKIGEVEWRKIKFDVKLAADNQAAQVKYDVQK